MTSGQPDYANTMLGPRVVPATNERRTTVFNDSDIKSGVPPSNRSANDYGKFFPRGMRGTIEEIPIYCLGNAVGTLTVNISPQPGMGPTYTTTITPPAVWGWVNAAFNIMWNYDSMYVWITACNAAVFWAYDNTVKPYDGHHTADAGATFTDLNERPFIRVIMTGETAGDVPVSGTINNIPIPNTSSRFHVDDKAIVAGVQTEIIRVEGAGYVDLVLARVNASADSDHTYVQIECDGNLAMDMTFIFLSMYGFNDDTQPLSIVEYVEDGRCTMMITKKFEFKRLFRVLCLNNLNNQIVHVQVYPNLMR